MSDVPPELFPNILSRLPVDSLLRFRSVCMSWRRIIDSPSFIKMHLHRQSEGGELVLRNYLGTRLYTLSSNSLNCCKSRTNTILAEPLKTLKLVGVPRIPILAVHSCHGLILVSHYNRRKIWALWNPYTRESLELPPFDYTSDRLIVPSSGIGYDCISDDYKVVKLARFDDPINRGPGGPLLETLVYSLKSNCWRRTKDFPDCFFPYRHQTGVFVHGALHWMTSTMEYHFPQGLIAFDLATEFFCKFQFPSAPSSPKRPNFKYLDALGGCLLLTSNHSIYRLDDYGGENLWTVLFSFSGMGFGDVRPIAYLKSKGEVLLQNQAEETDKYFWLDVEKKTAKKVSVDGVTEGRWSSQIWPASLVRLGNNSGFDQTNYANCTTKKKRKRKRSNNDRLELTLTTTDVQKAIDTNDDLDY